MARMVLHGSVTSRVMSPSATPLRSARPARPSPQGRVAEGPHGVMPERTGTEPYTPCLLAEAGSHETRAPRVPARVLVACSRGRDTRMARASPAVRREERDVLPVADGVLERSGGSPESGTRASPANGTEPSSTKKIARMFRQSAYSSSANEASPAFRKASFPHFRPALTLYCLRTIGFRRISPRSTATVS